MNPTQVEYVTSRSCTYIPTRHTDAKDAEHTTVATAMIQNAHATTLYRNLSDIPIRYEDFNPSTSEITGSYLHTVLVKHEKKSDSLVAQVKKSHQEHVKAFSNHCRLSIWQYVPKIFIVAPVVQVDKAYLFDMAYFTLTFAKWELHLIVSDIQKLHVWPTYFPRVVFMYVTNVYLLAMP